MDIGELISFFMSFFPTGKDGKSPDPTIAAHWQRKYVYPDHNRSWPPKSPPTDVIPNQSKIKMIVITTNVPNGTSASISVCHAETGEEVKDGKLDGLEIKANRVKDPATGKFPFFVFEDKHKPWEIWDKPFFFFKVKVEYKGLETETPKEFSTKKTEALRVLYWHASVADSIADSPAGGGLSTRSEMREIARIMQKEPFHKVYKRAFNQNNVPVSLWGSVIRNTYVYHHASHGNVVDRTNPATWISSANNPPLGPVGNWRSVVCLGQTDFGDNEVNQTGNVPSVPRYLVYMDTCVAGWEPSLGNAFISRGTQNYLAFKKYIPDGDARAMARKFYKKWFKTYKANPARIPQVFWDVGAAYYNSMRPVLMGKGAGSISSSQAVNDLNETLNEFSADLDEILS